MPADQYEIIGEKVTTASPSVPALSCDCLPSPGGQAQSHGSDLGLAGPAGCLEGSRADVSFGAGLLMDKFAWHCRCTASISAWRPAASRSPGMAHQLASRSSACSPDLRGAARSIRSNRVLHGRDTDQGAWRQMPGYSGDYGQPMSVLLHPSAIQAASRHASLTDGYAATKRYAEKTGIQPRRAGPRRGAASSSVDRGADRRAEALEQIKTLYAIEEQIRDASSRRCKQLHD